MMFLNGVPLFDQHGNPVNAHGGCILREGNQYYLFGEYKTDDENKYIGFSCYSSKDFYHWYFEGLALPPQPEGLLGPERVGERVKVLKSPQTGKYVMLMHTDDLKYCDPCIGLAVSDQIDGKFTFIGPLLFHGKPIRMWDMGTFVDEDGTAYLMTHEGDIYRLDGSCTSAVEKVAEQVAPEGESPALFKQNGTYFLMFSNKTSWERNDNYYLTAKRLSGPWEYKGFFCPAGSLTYNTQCSFVFLYDGVRGTVPVYLGDRWSFPRQASAATLVFLPIWTAGEEMRIEKYRSAWLPDTLADYSLEPEEPLSFSSNQKGEQLEIKFIGSKIAVFGESGRHGGYADFNIYDRNGVLRHKAVIDFYCLIKQEGLRYVSPELPIGEYTLRITVTGTNGVWFNKRGDRFGSDNYFVKISGWRIW